MIDHANELRRHARKIPHPQGETPGVMLRAADEIECLRAKMAEMEQQEPVAWYSRQYGFVYMSRQPSQFEHGSILYLRNGAPAWRIEGSSKVALLDIASLPHGTVFYALPGAQPAPSIKDAIIDDLQSQFDSEGITEHDSGGALIRLSAAIAAVEDNFVQIAPSVLDTYAAGINAVAAMLQSKADEYAKEHGHDDMGGLSFGPGMGGQIKMDYYTNLIELTDDVRAMIAAVPETKP